MKSSTDITSVEVWKTKAVAEKCSSMSWCERMHDFMNREDPNTYTKLEVAHGIASVNTGKCAWCGGPIR